MDVQPLPSRLAVGIAALTVLASCSSGSGDSATGSTGGAGGSTAAAEQGTPSSPADDAGGAPPDPSTGTQDASTAQGSADGSAPGTVAGPGGDELCSGADGIARDLTLMDASWEDDPEAFVTDVTAAAQRFTTLDPPTEITDSWLFLADFFTMVSEALDGVEPGDPEAVREALRFDDEAAFVSVLRFPGQAETVGVHVQDACGVDLGITPPVVPDVCATLEPERLEPILGPSAPAPEHRPWGAGVVECVWTGQDDAEIGAVVGPADLLRSDILQGAAPVGSVDLGERTADVHDGALGYLRSAAGRTAVIEVSGTGVLVSVRTGESAAEADTAVALADLIAAGLD